MKPVLASYLLEIINYTLLEVGRLLEQDKVEDATMSRGAVLRRSSGIYLEPPLWRYICGDPRTVIQEEAWQNRVTIGNGNPWTIPTSHVSIQANKLISDVMYKINGSYSFPQKPESTQFHGGRLAVKCGVVIIDFGTQKTKVPITDHKWIAGTRSFVCVLYLISLVHVVVQLLLLTSNKARITNKARACAKKPIRVDLHLCVRNHSSGVSGARVWLPPSATAMHQKLSPSRVKSRGLQCFKAATSNRFPHRIQKTVSGGGWGGRGYNNHRHHQHQLTIKPGDNVTFVHAKGAN